MRRLDHRYSDAAAHRDHRSHCANVGQTSDAQPTGDTQDPPPVDERDAHQAQRRDDAGLGARPLPRMMSDLAAVAAPIGLVA